jgi:hypothetical protein
MIDLLKVDSFSVDAQANSRCSEDCYHSEATPSKASMSIGVSLHFWIISAGGSRSTAGTWYLSRLSDGPLFISGAEREQTMMRWVCRPGD